MIDLFKAPKALINYINDFYYTSNNEIPKNGRNKNGFNKYFITFSALSIDEVYQELGSSSRGLTEEEAEKRLDQYGKNEIDREKPTPWYWMILDNFTNPFILVLIVIGIVSYFTEDIAATIIVAFMIALSVLMRFIQEYRSSQAAEALRMMVMTKATVKRLSPDEEDEEEIRNVKKEIPFEFLVPGDIIYLSAGDLIPADIRLIRSKDLFINQSSLTGESLPVGKYDIKQGNIEQPNAENIITDKKEKMNPFEQNNLCFMGTSVVSGFGKGIVIATGPKTFFGSLAKSIMGYQPETSFDKGINKVTFTLIKFIVIMIPIIFLINGLIKGEWKEAFLFALAVGVGLTPEMLPTIVTANLAKGAVAMSLLKVIVKRLNAIQSFGAMDILCTDKTGTLTQDKIILERYIDVGGEDNSRVLEYGYLNSYFQSGLKNMLDRAILDHAHLKKELNIEKNYKKEDEIPFDFIRKRMSIVVSEDGEQHILICKGSLDEMLKISGRVDDNGILKSLTDNYINKITELANNLSAEGFRIIAVGYKVFSEKKKEYTLTDESDVIILGLMAFLDPPKETATEAIRLLNEHNVKIKILTGDNDIVTKRVSKEVNLDYHNILLGSEIDEMNDEELSHKVEETTIFAKLTPLQKARIIKLLQERDHVVGFLGDGINDAQALRQADVGISVDSATDIAREAADIILLEKSLLVLDDGVLKGRSVYGNIIKYIKMTASSNFGNVLSVMIASFFLPFLPMLPLQILILNLFYDFSQLSIPWDKMDPEFLRRKRNWDPSGIPRFMLFIGPISSIFDVTTFAALWYIYDANSVAHEAFFQTGWFVESLLSQTLIVHMIRTKKIPFFQSMATWPVIITTVLIMIIGIYLPYSFIGPAIGFVELPNSYFIILAATLICYSILTQFVKVWYIKKFRAWL